MKTFRNLLWSVFLVVLVFFSGCKKSDDGTPTGGTAYVAPSLAKDTLINLPSQITTKAGSDGNLYILTSTAAIIDVYSSDLSTAFIYDQSTVNGWTPTANSDGSTSYTFSYLNFAVKLTYFSSSSDSWWKYEYDSASYSHPIYFIDDKGTSGETDWYNATNFKSPSVLALKNVWTKSGATTNSTLSLYNDDGITINTQYVSTSNTDKSGTLNIYEQINSTGPLVLRWNFIWDSTGSGSYTHYDTDGTTIIDSSTF